MHHRDDALPAVEPVPAPTAYQEVLRAIGRRLDREGWREVIVVEHPTGLLVQGKRAGDHGPEEAVLRLAPADLYREIIAARHQRGSAPQGQAEHPSSLSLELEAELRAAERYRAELAMKDRAITELRRRAEVAEQALTAVHTQQAAHGATGSPEVAPASGEPWWQRIARGLQRG